MDLDNEQSLQTRITQLRQANAEIKKFLNKLDLDTLPSDVSETLYNYSKLKKDTELHTLDLTYLEEFFLLRKISKLENLEKIAKIAQEVDRYKEELKKDNQEIESLEEFLQNNSFEPLKLDEGIVSIEQKLAGVEATYDQTLKQKTSAELDSLIEKILKLKQ